ncbi:MAG TPA: hypothetical protein GX497_10370 [Bacillus bacterium]|nr:hypothetical protein [Bacillus sp. (in: firmicutes)]
MWKYEHSVLTDASPQKVWELYRKTSEWEKWDKGLKEVTLNGPFENGVTGSLTTISQEPLPFTLKEVKENESFSNVTVLDAAGIQLDFYHRIEMDKSITKLIHGVVISGPNSKVMGNQIGPMITQGIPDAMSNLILLAGGKIL